jgi:hypothetical protein
VLRCGRTGASVVGLCGGGGGGGNLELLADMLVFIKLYDSPQLVAFLRPNIYMKLNILN